MPIIDSLRPRPDYLPLAIPEEIAPQLVKLHGAPIVWFIGQILKFLMKPSPDVEDFIAKHREKFDFKSPIVGVHVRRTDKINTEAAYHSLAEYMLHVEEYFDRVDLFNERQNKVVSIHSNEKMLISVLPVAQSEKNRLFGNRRRQSLEKRSAKV